MRSSIFFDISSELFFLVNMQELTFEYVNKNVTELLGYSAEELTSKPFLRFVHLEDQEKLYVL